MSSSKTRRRSPLPPLYSQNTIDRVARAIWDSFQTDKNAPDNDAQFFFDNRISLLRGKGDGFAEGHWSAAARAAIEAIHNDR